MFEEEEPEVEMPKNIAPLAMSFEAGLAVLAVVFGVAYEHSPTASLHGSENQVVENLQACGWGVLATLPLLLSFWAIQRWPFGSFKDLQVIVETRIVPLFAEATSLQLVLVSFAAGVGEELLFRGMLQDLLAIRLEAAGGIWTALVIASVFFGICHSISRTYFWLATILGAYLGGLYWLTGNLLAPIITHALYDAVVIVYLVRTKSSE